MARAPQQEVELRYAMLEAQLRDQLDLMNNALMEEESRIAAGEELGSILADHEVSECLVCLTHTVCFLKWLRVSNSMPVKHDTSTGMFPSNLAVRSRSAFPI